ncbi:hypothetical protein BVG16_13410 [Paenibacillus selenitireducens]|uniref:Uncharacterized protein n=1 Tax=Paenibacillus selenitireducens TaxID=1324314 RepID=A0A1T2XC80_9BACL|nr:hypothetical protein BVG16_13410 [Paenibacillus selenitireducens]
MCMICKGSRVDVAFNGSMIMVGPCICQDDEDHPGARMDGPGWGDIPNNKRIHICELNERTHNNTNWRIFP